MGSVVHNELDTAWMHAQGMYGYDIVVRAYDVYCVLYVEGGPEEIIISSMKGSEVKKVRVWRSAKQPSQNSFLYISIISKMAHATWGADERGNTIEEVAIIDITKLAVVFSFSPNWHFAGSERGEDAFIDWDCHYQSTYRLSGDSLLIETIEIISARITEKDYNQDETKTLNDPDCHPKLTEGTYLYDGNTFVKQKVKAEDK